MKYLLAIYGEEGGMSEAPTPEARAEMMQPWIAYTQAAQDAGVLRGGDGLQPSSTATVVRGGDSGAVVTDGPFAETKEQLGGYYLLECANLDEALDWAKKIPAIGYGGAVEVRPVMTDYDDANAPASGQEAIA